MIQKYLILIVCALAHISAFAEGFLAGTLVKTPSGYTEIEQLKVGDKVICYDFKGQCVTRSITHVQQEEVSAYAQITVGNDNIYAALDHKFYIPHDNTWVEARKIKPGNILLKHCTEYISVSDVQSIEASAVVYDITVDEYHNFFISHEDICVHNVFPIVAGIGLTIFFDGTVAITAGFAALGAAIGGILWSNHKEHQERERFYHGMGNYANSAYGASNSQPKRPCDPLNPNDTDCYYVDAPYHHINSRGFKNKCPKDGNAALHNSVRVDESSDSPRRIGISQDQFVVLDYHCNDPKGNCVFHGHVREWNELDDDMKNALRDSGMVKGKAKGRIIKK